MKTYDLYLHSGPKMKRTYVRVPSLMGCIRLAETTQDALDAAPDAIRAFLEFMARSGERVKPAAAFRTKVAEHDTSGGFLGIGFLPTDTKPLGVREADVLMRRLASMHDELRRIAGGLSQKQLDAKPAQGRPIGRILAHVCVEGAYLRAVQGASRLQRAADEGVSDPLDVLDELHALETERLHAMSPAERRDVVMRGQSPWSARYAVRRMLEHAWEHYREIGGRLAATAESKEQTTKSKGARPR